MASVNVVETFVSIQGESTYAGLSCFFVRLAGCNLRCRYCDTTYAQGGGGKPTEIPQLVEEAAASKVSIVEITGGEPLHQAGFAELATALRDGSGKKVLVETNGSYNIAVVPEGVVAIMDIKCPGSGVANAMDLGNIKRLRPYDEVKFVLSGRSDYEWARAVVKTNDLAAHCAAVLFSPVSGKVRGKDIASWVIADCLPVRVQVQLHKVLGIK